MNPAVRPDSAPDSPRVAEALDTLERGGVVTLKAGLARLLLLLVGSLILFVVCAGGLVNISVARFGFGEVFVVLLLVLGLLLFGGGLIVVIALLARASRALVISDRGLQLMGSDLVPWSKVFTITVHSFHLQTWVNVGILGSGYRQIRRTLPFPFSVAPHRNAEC